MNPLNRTERRVLNAYERAQNSEYIDMNSLSTNDIVKICRLKKSTADAVVKGLFDNGLIEFDGADPGSWVYREGVKYELDTEFTEKFGQPVYREINGTGFTLRINCYKLSEAGVAMRKFLTIGGVPQ